MNERPERITSKPADAVLRGDGPMDVPHVSRIREREAALGMSQRLLEQRLEKRVATDHPIEAHDAGRWKLGSDSQEIAVHELNRLRSAAARCLARSGREVRRRRINGNRAPDAAIEQLEGQPADSRTYIEKRTIERTCFNNQVPKQTRRRARAGFAIASQVASGHPLVEMPVRNMAEARTA